MQGVGGASSSISALHTNQFGPAYCHQLEAKKPEGFLTKLQVVSGELPLPIVWQLGGVNKDVVIAFAGFNDLPPHLVFGFLRGRKI